MKIQFTHKSDLSLVFLIRPVFFNPVRFSIEFTYNNMNVSVRSFMA